MTPTRAALLLLAAGVVLLVAAGVASASYVTSRVVVDGASPVKDSTWSYTVRPGSPTDSALDWRITLRVCIDTDQDQNCWDEDINAVPSSLLYNEMREITHPGGTDSTSRTVSWTNVKSTRSGVLNDNDVGTYYYDFRIDCQGACVIGQNTPATSDHYEGTATFAYTDTWTATVAAPGNPKSGATGTLTATFTSTNANDRRLCGTGNTITGSQTTRQPSAVQFYVKPNGGAERLAGAANCYVVGATSDPNGVRTRALNNVLFDGVGPYAVRVQVVHVDTVTASSSTFTDLLPATFTNVNDAELHAETSRLEYNEGAVAALYVDLHGHGAPALDPDPRPNVPVTLTFLNGTVQLERQVKTTDAAGRIYTTFQTAAGLRTVTWTAVTDAFAWNGNSYAKTATGIFEVRPVSLLTIQDDLDGVRDDVRALQDEGVQLSTEGLANLLNHGVRALGAILVVAAVVAFVILAATRL